MQEKDAGKKFAHLHEKLGVTMKDINDETALLRESSLKFEEVFIVLGSLNGLVQTRFEENKELITHLTYLPREFETMSKKQQYALITARYKEIDQSLPFLLVKVYETAIKRQEKTPLKIK